MHFGLIFEQEAWQRNKSPSKKFSNLPKLLSIFLSFIMSNPRLKTDRNLQKIQILRIWRQN